MHVYLITDLKTGKCYVGAEKNGNNPEYYGSSREIDEIRKRLGEKEFKKRFKKEILIDNISSQEELNEIESYFIMGLDVLVPNGYNKKIYQWPPPVEACVRGAKKTYELKRGLFDPANKEKCREGNRKGAIRTHKLYPKMMCENAKKGAETIAEKRKVDPNYDREYINTCVKAGKIGGTKSKELGVGLFDPVNKEKIREGCSKAGKKGGEVIAEKRKADPNYDREYRNSRREGGRKAAETNKRQGTGFYDPRVQSMGGKKTYELKIGVHAPGM